jgi:NodT family efflux transporter outer membrane factor (OMF) lipoprotein
MSKKASPSFLKKRSKKLLFAGLTLRGSTRLKSKSFLVLFFKKEHSSLLSTIGKLPRPLAGEGRGPPRSGGKGEGSRPRERLDRRSLALLTLSTALTGCMVGPDYHRPEAPVPTTYKELPGWKLATPADAAPKGQWWLVFNDPTLNELEPQIDIGNQTLKEDEAAYRNAQALVDEARANLFPVLSANAGVTRSSSGSGGGSVISSTGLTTSGGTTSTGGKSAARTQYSLEGSASWTIDVWGAIRRQVQSDVANAQASAATLANARLSAQGSLATYYMELRETDALQRVLNDTVAGDKRALEITQNQYAAGTSAQSDVITARTQLDAAEAAAINVGVARAQYEHAIAVLVGKPPMALSISVVQAVPPVPDIPGMVPSALLERRPDVAAAERSMKAENALIGVAVAAYYPTVDLSALFGYAGNPLNSLVSAANRVWSLGASASETLFNGGDRSAAVRAARANYDEAVATYRETVLTAFQQVEDALSSLRILAQQDQLDSATVADAKKAVEIALNEYEAGTQAYTTVITAQNTLLSAQETEVSVQETRLTEAVALIEALGGGWSAADLPDRDWLQRRNPLLP